MVLKMNPRRTKLLLVIGLVLLANAGFIWLSLWLISLGIHLFTLFVLATILTTILVYFVFQWAENLKEVFDL